MRLLRRCSGLARVRVAPRGPHLAAVGGCLLLAASAGCAAPKLPSTPGVDARGQVLDGRLALGEMRFRPEVCQGEALTPEYTLLDEQHLLRFLEKQGVRAEAARARGDLVYLQLRLNPEAPPVRLRVAILPSVTKAGEELHQGIREHGAGWWGVHRANIAVLGPEGSLEDIVAFVSRTKLACWGVVTVGGEDYAVAVPGAYRQI